MVLSVVLSIGIYGAILVFLKNTTIYSVINNIKNKFLKN